MIQKFQLYRIFVVKYSSINRLIRQIRTKKADAFGIKSYLLQCTLHPNQKIDRNRLFFVYIALIFDAIAGNWDWSSTKLNGEEKSDRLIE